MTLSLNALRTSGRLRNTRATGPSRVIWRVAVIGRKPQFGAGAGTGGRGWKVGAGGGGTSAGGGE